MDDRTSGPAAVAAVGDATVDDEAGLRGLYKQPMGLAVLKQLDRLDAHCRNFLAHSPFAVIGSTRPGRGTDVSPRGDAPGFARVLDDHTIAIPDRPGNNRLDTLSNIVTDAEVGLLFFIPGIDETLRDQRHSRSCRATPSFFQPRPSGAASRAWSSSSRYARPSCIAARP